ncbi:MAG: HAMP domain-containing histidine kinase [Alphaproteobacteria bacterium]|nr:HAMP domain-containing histidine kinase [Alphaproteobacteria bacterium]
MISNIVAITSDIDTADRVHILASGFDAIMDISLMDHKDLKQILLNMLDKGRNRLQHRVQHEEYQRFKASLSASPDAFVVLDHERKVFFVSEHYRRAYPKNGHLLKRGVVLIEAYDTLSAEHGILPGDPRYSQLRKFWENPQGQAEVTFDNGRTWRIKAAPLEGVEGTIVTTTDITDYSRQNDMLSERSGALEKALEMEKEAAAIQKQFINMVSHEFRTPLSIIDGNAQILLRRLETLSQDVVRQRLTTVRSAVSRLVGMMEGVLSSNMLRTGRMELAVERFDIRPMMTEMCREYADLSSTHLIDCLIDELPDTVVLDKKALTLILSNLVGNAVKFTRDRPHIKVIGKVVNNEIVITVKDNGVGIPENEVDKVFERYYRATTAGSIPGTGIGLHLVHELVTLHGGRITVQSAMGQGTEITVAFPLFEDPAAAEGVLAHANAASA